MKTINSKVAVGFGSVYIVVGLLGFAVTGGVDFAESQGEKLLGLFMVNPVHNIAHILIGAALVIAGLKGLKAAKVTNATIGIAYLALGVLGLFIAGSHHGINFLALNSWDNGLHFISALLLILVAAKADKKSL